MSQPTRQCAEISVATRSASALSTQASTTSSATRASLNRTGTCRRRSGCCVPGFGAEHELAFLGEEDAGPGAGAVLDERRDDVAEDVVGVAALGQDPVDRSSAAVAVTRPALELEDALAEQVGHRQRPPSRLVDPDERLLRGDHQLVVLAVGELVGGVVVGHARRADPLDAHEDLEQVVEPRGRVVLDRRGAHREVALGRAQTLRGRGAGGTPCARGRSTACSGRSRQRPERRSRRTRPACTPRTETAAAGRSCAQARSPADPSRVPARCDRGRTAGARHRKYADRTMVDAACHAVRSRHGACPESRGGRLLRLPGSRAATTAPIKVREGEAGGSSRERHDRRKQTNHACERRCGAGRGPYRLLQVPGTGVRLTGRGAAGSTAGAWHRGSPRDVSGGSTAGAWHLGFAATGRWPAGSTAGAWHRGWLAGRGRWGNCWCLAPGLRSEASRG